MVQGKKGQRLAVSLRDVQAPKRQNANNNSNNSETEVTEDEIMDIPGDITQLL